MKKLHVKKAIHACQQGGIIAYPTEAVFGLGCIPFFEHSVQRILKLKKDYIFFAIADEHDQFLASWFIGDLKVFRVWFMKQLWTNKRKFTIFT